MKVLAIGAYYAMFNAAHAALIAVNPSTNLAVIRTHSGLIAAFGREIVQTGYLDAELGRSLNRVESMRKLADYTGEVEDAKAVMDALVQAERFVHVVSTMLG